MDWVHHCSSRTYDAYAVEIERHCEINVNVAWLKWFKLFLKSSCYKPSEKIKKKTSFRHTGLFFFCFNTPLDRWWPIFSSKLDGHFFGLCLFRVKSKDFYCNYLNFRNIYFNIFWNANKYVFPSFCFQRGYLVDGCFYKRFLVPAIAEMRNLSLRNYLHLLSSRGPHWRHATPHWNKILSTVTVVRSVFIKCAFWRN